MLAASAGVTAVATVGLPGGRAGASSVAPGSDATDTVQPVPSAGPTAAAATSGIASSPTKPSHVQLTPLPSRTLKEGAQPTPSTATPTPTAVTATPTTATPTTIQVSPTSPAPMTPACQKVTDHLLTTVEAPEYLPYKDPGNSLIGWSDAKGPLTVLVVNVRCAPFSVTSMSPENMKPIREITVLDAHRWLIGDATSGNLQLVWNPDGVTMVSVMATVAPGADRTAAENALLTFGNTLSD